MDLLQEARTLINEVDSQMAQLFVRRMEAAQMVAQYKQAHGMPILDPEREEAVIRNGSARVADPELQPYYVDFMKNTMAVSRQYQHRLLHGMKVAYCGTEGAFAHLAADKLFHDAEKIAYKDMEITVELGTNSYRITILRGALARANDYMQLNRKVLIVTDSGVPAQYAQTVAACCGEPVIVTVPQGESSKNLQNFALLCRTMLEKGFTRTDCVIAVGGGVVGDLAGFAAASFLRGIDFYNIPTTVLSQVDSSVGGKVAIDLDQIKNCVGAFHQPKAVLIDPEVLRTLPARQIANGLAEAVKMAVTFDENLLTLFETEDPMAHIDQIIAASLRIKAAVVRQDERESGLRRVLNFGHTIGHGIETAVGLESLYHGECVALGMLPMCDPQLRRRLQGILERLGLPTVCQADPAAVWEAIHHDKKRAGSTITVVYAPKAGSFTLQTMPLEDLKETVFAFLGEKES